MSDEREEYWSTFLNNIDLLVDTEGSIEKVAVKAGVPYFTIYNWTKGKQRPRLESVRLIADAYDITIDDLLGTPLTAKDLL